MPKDKVSKDDENELDEESDLEEILDEDDEVISIDEHRFTEFLRPIHGSAPVLEEVAGFQTGPVFFAMGGGGQSQERENNGDDDPFKYANQGGGNGEDPKYVSMSDTGRPLERVDIMNVGREQELTRNVGFVQSTETRGMESQMYEKKMDAERVDPLKVGTHETIQKEKQKQYWIK